MKIAFLFHRDKEFNGETVRNEPCGGTEKAVVYLSEALERRGHQCEIEWKAGCLSFEPDVVIAQEAILFQGIEGERFPGASHIWWTHHFADQSVTIQNAPYARAFCDDYVCLSEVQRQDLYERFKIDCKPIRYGVNPDEAVKSVKIKGRLIYASTPFRGLARIVDLWPRLKARVPYATIDICSGMGIYGQEANDASYRELYDELRALDGVYVHGPLNQEELFAKFAEAQALLYPCDWAETYCLTLDEALMHGCYPITTGFAALGERAHGFDFDKDMWINAVEDLSNVKNPPGILKQPISWDEVAEQWEAIF